MPLFCVTLALLLSLQTDTALSNQDSHIVSQAFDSTTSDGVAQGAPRRTARRRARHNKRLSKSMQKAAAPKNPDNAPVLDAPNRMEIDPGDIPPANRPRDPNVDDRTRIPGEISPDDISPRPKPKGKKP
jgi:hypothetical protein